MSHFPQTLKTWRKARHFSQLDLALEADVSARHISFLETGRAKPSREMIARLCDAMRLPLATRNQILTHAGFAPRYPARAWADDDMEPIRNALRHMLDQHAPYPGFALDRLWRIVQINAPARKLFAMIGVSEGSNLLELLQSDDLPGFIENWPDVAYHTAQRLRTESAAQGGIEELDRAAHHLSKTPSPPDAPPAPVISTIYRAGGLRLSLFSTLAQFGTPEDVTLDNLKIELFHPSDPQTEALLRAM